MHQSNAIRQSAVEANGLSFGYLEAGEGPLVLLLHGFPDNAWTWSAQMSALSDAGYRAVAPFIRGYPPTDAAPDRRYDAGALGDDVAALIEAFGAEPAFVVGNDWGAVSAYAAMALHPEAIRRSAVIAAGHTATLTPTLNHPDQMHHIFHFWFFQLQDMAPPVVRNGEFAFVDYLWRHWSTDGFDDSDHIAQVKETLTPPGATEAAIAYYPALLRLAADHPEVAERMRAKTTVPTLAIFGEADPPRALSADEHVHFTSEYRLEIVPKAGHFVHREQPDHVNRLLLEWFGAKQPQGVAAQAGTRVAGA